MNNSARRINYEVAVCTYHAVGSCLQSCTGRVNAPAAALAVRKLPQNPKLFFLAYQSSWPTTNDQARHAAAVAARVLRLMFAPRDFMSQFSFCDNAVQLYSHLPAFRVTLKTLQAQIAATRFNDAPDNLFCSLSTIADVVLREKHFDYTSKQVVVFTYNGNLAVAANARACMEKIKLLHDANVQVILIGVGLCPANVLSLGELATSSALTFLNWDYAVSIQEHVYELCGLMQQGQQRKPKYLPAQELHLARPRERFCRDKH